MDFSWAGFEWIDLHDVDQSIILFLRRANDPEDFLLVVCNFTPVPRTGYWVGAPRGGFYRELLNTDAAAYGGSNMGNAGGLPADEIPWQGQSHSLLLTLPPLAVVVLKPGPTPQPPPLTQSAASGEGETTPPTGSFP